MQTGNEVTPPQKVTDSKCTICGHDGYFFSRQYSIPHIHAIHLAKKALLLLKTSTKFILILSQDKNTTTGDHVACRKVQVTFHKWAIYVKVPRSSGVLPRGTYVSQLFTTTRQIYISLREKKYLMICHIDIVRAYISTFFCLLIWFIGFFISSLVYFVTFTFFVLKRN